ncbi:MAG: FkbM family methyltransferase [Ruminococcaceae bacterium]|nr:FkbM family methyltransferase [Oscillospiraceae bacterium]
MDLWQTLAATDKTIVMYGMGNGADKILAVCEQYGIEVKEFFASDDFVRGQQFHGKTVRRFSDVCEQYGAENLVVLVSFASSLPDVMNNIAHVASVCETYIPDVPVKGDTLFCEAYEREHERELEKACAALADERSREVFRGVVEFRRTGRLDVLLRTQDDRESVMRELLHLDDYRVAIDAGAYDGDTARELIEWCPRMECIWAFEPDRRNFRKLGAYAEGEARVKPINAAVWNETTTLIFEDSGNRNAGVDTDGRARRTIEVKAMAIDDRKVEGRVDYIKYDVEGSEKEALEGSARTIREDKPDLLISLYHRTEDLHELILQVKEMCPEYRLYVRRYPYIPAWDLNLYATAR